MDVDWCLTCEKRVEAPSLYCSPACKYLAASSSSTYSYSEDEGDDIIFHPVHHASPIDTFYWTGNDSVGISAWAAEVPYGPPPEPSISPFTSHNLYRPPQLLPPHHQIVPPSLCTSTPQPPTPSPSNPLVTPKPHHTTPNFTTQPSDGTNTSRISFKSAPTESSLATPASSHPMPIQQQPNCGRIYSHVRSWVIPPSSPSLVTFKRATSPAMVNSLKLIIPVSNTRRHAVGVVSPSDASHGFLDENPVQWNASSILPEQPCLKRVSRHQQLRGSRLPHEFPRQIDEHPSFRARGRKASRAVA